MKVMISLIQNLCIYQVGIDRKIELCYHDGDLLQPMIASGTLVSNVPGQSAMIPPGLSKKYRLLLLAT